MALSEKAKVNIQKGRDYLDKKNGITFGAYLWNKYWFCLFYNFKISNENSLKLQENLVKSHSYGTGDEVPTEIVKLMLLLKIQYLSYGRSGIQLQTVKRLIAFYNNDNLPVIFD